MIDRLLTVAEAAELLQVSKSTVYRYAENSALPHIRKKFGLRFRCKDLDAWLDQGKRNCLPAAAIAFDLAQISRPAILGRGNSFTMAKSGKARTQYCYLGRNGTVNKRHSKKWGTRYYINFVGADGERKQKIVKRAQNLDEAVAELMKEMAEAEANRQGHKKPDRINLRDFSERYLEKYALTNKRSWKTDRSYIKGMAQVLGDRFLDEITSEDVEEFKTYRLEHDGVEKSTVNRCLAIMRKMFNIAVEWNYLRRDQVPKFKLFPEGNVLKERILSETEEAALLSACSDHLRSILIVALNSGCRLGEILNLKWDQVNLKARALRVERTKNNKIRMIPINTALFDEFSRLKSTQGVSEYVFLNPKTQKPYGSIKTAFRAACRRAGIKGLRLHDARHTFASRLISNGIDLITIKDLLGHGSVRITEKYAHSNQEQKRKAVAVLGEKVAEYGQVPTPLCKKRVKSAFKKFPTPLSPSFSIN